MEQTPKIPTNHNEYFYGKKKETTIPVAQEVLKHDFTKETVDELKSDRMALKEEQEKIREVKQKLRNIQHLDPSVTINSLPEEEQVIASESEEEIEVKLKEAEKILEEKNPLIRILHKVERKLGLRA